MNRLYDKFNEVVRVVLPFILFVLFFNFTLVPLGSELLGAFLISSGFIVLGLTFFLLGVDLGITPMGNQIGPLLGKTKRIWSLVLFAFIIGFFISYAEPALLVMSIQVEELSLGLLSASVLNVSVSVGIGVMVVVGFIRIFYNLPLYKILFVSYGLVLLIALSASPQMLAIAFDASGVTTGVLAVPFLLSLSMGVTNRRKDSKASEKDSFGMIAIASVGAILSVLILNIVFKPGFVSIQSLPELETSKNLLHRFSDIFFPVGQESVQSIFPLFVIFLIIALLNRLFKTKLFKRISIGFIYALLGLFLFLVGINASFIEVGRLLGSELILKFSAPWVILIGFALGVVTILAEPAVAILTQQIEEVTSGYISRKAVNASLAIGVGFAIALSVLRIVVVDIQLWHYLLPGYLFALALSLFVPKLFVGIAFDAGGVATGPMISSIVMAFVHGIANTQSSADILIDGFGMVALVALMPVITIQILGLIFKLKMQRSVPNDA